MYHVSANVRLRAPPLLWLWWLGIGKVLTGPFCTHIGKLPKKMTYRQTLLGLINFTLLVYAAAVAGFMLRLY